MIHHSSEALSGLKTEPMGSYLERKLERNLKAVICVTTQYYTNGRQSVDSHYMQEPSKVIFPGKKHRLNLLVRWLSSVRVRGSVIIVVVLQCLK
jgi:hypothetical protein